MTKVNLTDPDFVLMCAFDYCNERSTFAPSILEKEIVTVWNDLKPATRSYIKSHIKHSKSYKWNQIKEL